MTSHANRGRVGTKIIRPVTSWLSRNPPPDRLLGTNRPLPGHTRVSSQVEAADNFGGNGHSSKLYGPADRHAVIEWLYLLRTGRGVTQLATFSVWLEDGQAAFEGWASLNFKEGAVSQPARRSLLSDLQWATVQSDDFRTVIGSTLSLAEVLFLEIPRSVQQRSQFLTHRWLTA